MKKYILFFVSIGLLLMTILVYNVLNIENEKSMTFTESGYILNNLSERYYFLSDEKYKTSYDNKITFLDTEGSRVSIENDNFIHYNSGNIVGLQDGVLLDLNRINDDPITYYNVTANKEMKRLSNCYVIKNLNEEIKITKAIWKISQNKYIILANEIDIKLNNGTSQKVQGYIEIEYSDNEIVNIYNQEVSYQTISSDSYIDLEDDIRINLATKIVSQDNENKMSLEDMVINSDDNVTLVDLNNNIEEEKAEDEENEVDNQVSNQTNITNNNSNITNNNSNIINQGGSGDGSNNNIKFPDIKYDNLEDNETEVDTSKTLNEPILKIKKMNITSIGVDGEIEIVDNDDLLSKEKTIDLKIINNNTGKITYTDAYKYEEIRNSKLAFYTNVLLPEVKYTLVVSATYSVGENTYTKNFIYKTFTTSGIGISIEKDGFTDTKMNFQINFTDPSIVEAKISLLNSNGDFVNEDYEEIIIDTTTKNIEFENLQSNTAYNIRIYEIKYNGAIQTGAGWDLYKTFSTLKKKATIRANYSIDKRNGKFYLKADNIIDDDKSIQNYVYKMYRVEMNNNEIIYEDNEIVYNNNYVYSKETNDNEIEVTVGKEENQDNIVKYETYVFEIIANCYDNEKNVEIKSEICGPLVLGAKTYPDRPIFIGENITTNSIKGYVEFYDNDNAIIVDNDHPLIIQFSPKTSANEDITITDLKQAEEEGKITVNNEGKYSIGVELNELKPNTGYNAEIKGYAQIKDNIENNFLLTTNSLKTEALGYINVKVETFDNDTSVPTDNEGKNKYNTALHNTPYACHIQLIENESTAWDQAVSNSGNSPGKLKFVTYLGSEHDLNYKDSQYIQSHDINKDDNGYNNTKEQGYFYRVKNMGLGDDQLYLLNRELNVSVLMYIESNGSVISLNLDGSETNNIKEVEVGEYTMIEMRFEVKPTAIMTNGTNQKIISLIGFANYPNICEIGVSSNIMYDNNFTVSGETTTNNLIHIETFSGTAESYKNLDVTSDDFDVVGEEYEDELKQSINDYIKESMKNSMNDRHGGRIIIRANNSYNSNTDNSDAWNVSDGVFHNTKIAVRDSNESDIIKRSLECIEERAFMKGLFYDNLKVEYIVYEDEYGDKHFEELNESNSIDGEVTSLRNISLLEVNNVSAVPSNNNVTVKFDLGNGEIDLNYIANQKLYLYTKSNDNSAYFDSDFGAEDIGNELNRAIKDKYEEEGICNDKGDYVIGRNSNGYWTSLNFKIDDYTINIDDLGFKMIASAPITKVENDGYTAVFEGVDPGDYEIICRYKGSLNRNLKPYKDWNTSNNFAWMVYRYEERYGAYQLKDIGDVTVESTATTTDTNSEITEVDTEYLNSNFSYSLMKTNNENALEQISEDDKIESDDIITIKFDGIDKENYANIAGANLTLENTESSINKVLEIQKDSEGYYAQTSLEDFENIGEVIGQNSLKTNVEILYNSEYVDISPDTNTYVTYTNEDDEFIKLNKNSTSISENMEIYNFKNVIEDNKTQTTTLFVNDLEDKQYSPMLEWTSNGLKYKNEYIEQNIIKELSINSSGNNTLSTSNLKIIDEIDIKEKVIKVEISAKTLGIETQKQVFADICIVENNKADWDNIVKTIDTLSDNENNIKFIIEGLDSDKYYAIRFRYIDENGDEKYIHNKDLQIAEYKFGTIPNSGIKNIEFNYIAKKYNEKYLSINYDINQDILESIKKIQYNIYSADNDKCVYSIEDTEINTEGNSSINKLIDMNPKNNILDIEEEYYIEITPVVNIEENEYKLKITKEEFKIEKLQKPEVGLKIIKDTELGILKLNININDIYGVTFGENSDGFGEYKLEISKYSDKEDKSIIVTEDLNLRDNGTNFYKEINNIDFSYNYDIKLTMKLDMNNDGVSDKEKVVTKTIDKIKNSVSIGDMEVNTNEDNIKLIFNNTQNITKIDTFKYTIQSKNNNLKNDNCTANWKQYTDEEQSYYYLEIPYELKESDEYIFKIQFLQKNKLIEEEEIFINKR